jgi:predicted DNA-binding transcriptional regulator AlpA
MRSATASSPIEPSTFLSTAQVRADLGGVSRMWIHRAIRTRGFPRPQKLGGSRSRGRNFFLRSEYETWRAAQREREATQTNQTNSGMSRDNRADVAHNMKEVEHV